MSGITILIAALTIAAPPDDSTIQVDANRVVNRVSRLMYGSCIEDVNHEIYGGLYAQMIFGESFEEPPQPPMIPGWTAYGGRWMAGEGGVSTSADFGAKFVRESPELADGTVTCDVRLRDARGGNAGLILRVRDPKVGADNWVGYEVSISASGHHLMLGKHRNNYRQLKQVPAEVVPGRWHRLRVEMAGATLRVYLDDAREPSLSYTDDSEPLPAGRVGLRTWGSDADYRNLTIEGAGSKVAETFTPAPGSGVRDGLSGAWDPLVVGEGVARFTWEEDRPYNSSRSQRIERTGGEDAVGIINRGLNRWGLSVREGKAYSGRVYLRVQDFSGRVTVALQNADGSRTYAQTSFGHLGSDWSGHDFTLKSDASDPHARFALWIDGPGKVWVDQVYLSPTEDALFRGLPFRGDIAKGLLDEGLTVLRYGGSMVNVPGYRWKSMIGDRDKRPQYRGNWYPQSTNGFGIEEFVLFCRAAGFEPIVTINIEETPQDAADLVDYLNGPTSTVWGRRRAENGHPEPYHVRYLQIGNEELTNAHYVERFRLLHETMWPRDPSLQFIIGAWWEPDNPISRRIVTELNGKAALWDLHVGGDDPREGTKVDAMVTRMRSLLQQWVPGTSLRACILEENGGKHNLARALGHATILNAAQRHGDFVVIQCPANCLQPWKQNDNDWDQGQLFFTSNIIWGMPPYYSQQMAAAAHLPCRLRAEIQSPGDDLDVTATRDEAGTTLVLKVVNTGERPHSAAITLDHVVKVEPRADVSTLSGLLDDRNSPDAPDRIRPKKSTFEGAASRFSYEFPARSYTIITLRTTP